MAGKRLSYRKHKEKIVAKRKADYAANRDAVRARVKKWYAENRERVSAKNKEWRQRNSAWRAGEYLADASDRRKLAEKIAYGCAYCGSYNRLEVDHKFPKSRGGLDELSNLQWLCHTCNRSKHTLTEDEFFAHIMKLVARTGALVGHVTCDSSRHQY